MNQEQTLQAMHHMVLLYLEGESSAHDEQQVLKFINESDENMAQFRLWEEQWQQTCSMSPQAIGEWQRVEAAIDDAREAEQRKHGRRHRLQWWLTTAAAVIVFAVIASVATWVIYDNSHVQLYTCSAPYGGKAKVTLPDGSVAWLNAGTTLTYSSQFHHKNRRVELHGEGYFEVAKSHGAEFVVATRGCDVTVKGTHFNVCAYDDNSWIRTSLIEGKVEVSRGNKRLTLNPGEEATVNLADGSLVKSVATAQANAWVDRRLSFYNITMDELAKVLSRNYDVRIHICSQRIKSRRFSVSLRNKETVTEVLRALGDIEQFDIRQDGKDIYLTSRH